jgi:AraC-like DNA-binding protein
MQGIRASIEEHLGDPEITPEMIAKINFVSTSYLHKLFHKYEGVSMGSWVRAVRLRRCHRDLTDPALADRKIIEIASDWGFPTASHFSRAFRSTYGYSPRELRRNLAEVAA